jgi:hypothetical protein
LTRRLGRRSASADADEIRYVHARASATGPDVAAQLGGLPALGDIPAPRSMRSAARAQHIGYAGYLRRRHGDAARQILPAACRVARDVPDSALGEFLRSSCCCDTPTIRRR